MKASACCFYPIAYKGINIINMPKKSLDMEVDKRVIAGHLDPDKGPR
jgi:hypothetical protein